ncbi:hypothetical protein P8452_41768 [Trifolium repens]|nr:hypothetical protein P8452_41768 [Trifolium repens]
MDKSLKHKSSVSEQSLSMNNLNFFFPESPSSFSRCLWPTRLVREIAEASFRLGADQPQLILFSRLRRIIF